MNFILGSIRIIVLLTFWGNTLNSFSQDIYFLQGQNFLEEVDIEGEDVYPVQLYRLHKDTLVSNSHLSIYETNVGNIRMYYESKKIIIHHYALFNDSSKYCFIDFIDQLRIKHQEVFDDGFGCYKNFLINRNNQTYLLIQQTSNDSQTRRFIGLNSKGRLKEKFSDSDLQYYIGDGCQGFGVEDLFQSQQTEQLFVKAINDEKNELTYYLKPITDYDRKHVFQMPNVQGLKMLDDDFTRPTSKYGQYQVKINTHKYLILDGKVRAFDGYTCKKQYLIYIKEKNHWTSKDFKGSYASNRCFGDWLAGSIADDTRRLPDEKKNKPISGKEFRVQEKTEWGSPADMRFKELSMYPYGILFLYNLETGKYIEWEALENDKRQGDSEILYVENNTVIYRVNNKIYSANIDKEQLSQTKLLIQDERVPYIHWAFILKG